MQNGKPVLAIVGWGRAGKDTICEWLRDHAGIKFTGGCSWVARHHMAERLSMELGRSVTPDEAYATRHMDVNTRNKWKSYLDEYRKEDPARIVRDCLKESEIICGIRDIEELYAAQDEGLMDLTVWVSRRGTPEDVTVTFNSKDCDIIVDNSSSKEVLYSRVRNLARCLGYIRE